MILLDGKTTSQKILSNLQEGLILTAAQPRLDIILVGEDPGSIQYVNMKKKRAENVGIVLNIHNLPENTSEDELKSLIQDLNKDLSVTGFMIQLPLPKHISKNVLNLIDPKKDADGLTAQNLGLLFERDSQAIPPATAQAVTKLLAEYKIDLRAKNAVVVGRSNEVGLPIAAMLLAANATVTVCHSHTQNLSSLTSQADILVSAVGKPKLITADYVKEGAVVIDVGLSPDPQTGKLVGDVDFDTVAPKTSYITPVPGGVGPMTIACLLQNTFNIYQSNGK